jgi:hypothetical protein
VPAWSQPGTWFYFSLSFFLALVDTGNLIAIYALARRIDNQERAVHVAWVYTVLLIPLLALFVGFDSLALLFLLLAALFTLDRRSVLSGIATGLGFMTKLTPIAALPAAFQHLAQPRQRLKLLLATCLSTLLIALPFLITGPAYLFQSLKSPVIRSTWETVWALIDGYYSYGVAGGVDRFDPAMAGAAQHPTRLPWLVITIGFLLFYLALYTRRVDWTSRRKSLAFTALTLNLLTLYFKGYSPQFLVMLLPFVVLLLPGLRAIAYMLILSFANVVEYPLYFLVLPQEKWLLTATVLIRTLVLLIVSVEYAAQVYDWRIPERGWNRLAAVTSVGVLILALVGATAGITAYAEIQYLASPHRPALTLLEDHAEPSDTLTTDLQDTYEHLYPPLHRRMAVRLVETYDWLPPWQDRLAAVTNQVEGDLWVYSAPDSPLQSWLEERFTMLDAHDLDDWRLSQWDIP